MATDKKTLTLEDKYNINETMDEYMKYIYNGDFVSAKRLLHHIIRCLNQVKK